MYGCSARSEMVSSSCLLYTSVLDDTVRTLRVRRGETTELVIENTPILGQIQVVKKSAQDNPVTCLLYTSRCV